jgi:hypothetical protein
MISIDEILAEERRIRNKLADPAVSEIMVPRAFRMEQIGLRSVMVDRLGRFWDVSDNPIRMIFDPHVETRNKRELDRG